MVSLKTLPLCAPPITKRKVAGGASHTPAAAFVMGVGKFDRFLVDFVSMLYAITESRFVPWEFRPPMRIISSVNYF